MNLPDDGPVLVDGHFAKGANTHVACATVPAIDSVAVLRKCLEGLTGTPDHARYAIVPRPDGGHYEIAAWWVEHPEDVTP